uniref:acid sphingomyelinase-like phosphodiesterase 3b n=1 Tax=Styela clava TaxID=7725 RepID=UPI00193A085D|nr:acid sphingomyelinase-like phosphodiesterase 3b [Styela clava]
MRYRARWICSLFFVYTMLVLNARSQNTGTFWHISDHHLDPYYTENGQTPMEVCPSSYGRQTDAGPLGDYVCDSPWKLINSSAYAMKKIEPNPDFIIWTGDDSLHTADQDKYLGVDKVIEIVGNITALLREVFPDTKFYPALGNHDYHPKSQIPPGGSAMLTAFANIWQDWLTADAYESFKREGYYKENLDPNGKHVLIALNSNFWYDSNKVVDGTGDPGGEFAWLEESLKSASQNSQKVFIIGHVPPGYFELAANSPKRWFYPEYNKRFISIIQTYADVISGQFFGHHHSDTFKIFKDGSGNTIASMLLTPAVTPWRTTLPGVNKGSNNPAIRLFEYNKDTLFLKDFQQYYLNLEEANTETSADEDSWKLEYRATESYNIPDVSTTSWGTLAKKMRDKCEADSSDCPKEFTLYQLHNSASYNTDPCNETCQRFQLCAITEQDIEQYELCQEKWGSAGFNPVVSVYALAIGILFYFLIV